MSDAHRDDIAKLESLYADHPEGRIFTHLAEAYRKAGELGRAHDVLDEGLQRHPDYSSAHVVRGRVLLDQDRTEEADAEFRRVLELDAHNLVAIRAVADLARGRGDHDTALAYYRQLLDQDPNEEVREIVEELSAEAAVSPDPAEPPGREPVGPEPYPSEGAGPEIFGTEDLTEGFASAAPEGLTGPEAPPSEAGPAWWEEEQEQEPADAAGAFGGWSLDVGETAEETPAQEEDDWVGGSMDLGGPTGGEAGPLEGASEDPEAPAEPLEAAEDREVHTETIAQVYARQGHYDRAAEVYRELVRARPGDEGLRERLAEMEELAAARASDDGEVAAVSDYPAGSDSEAVGAGPGIEGFESGELDASGADAAPLEGLEATEFDPESGLRAEAAPETARPGEDLSEELGVTEVPEPPEEASWSEEDAADEPDWLASVRGDAPDEDASEEEELVDSAGSVWTGSDWGEDDAAATPHAWTEMEEEEDASPPIRDYFGGLLEWGGGRGSGPSEPPPSAERATPAEETTSAEGTASEDDDLEMFRSWLESLKQ